MIGEVASTEQGGSKGDWIQEALSSVPAEYSKVGALLWFEKYDDGMDWPIESSSAATSAFANAIQNPVYRGNSYGNLRGRADPSRPVIPGSVGAGPYTCAFALDAERAQNTLIHSLVRRRTAAVAALVGLALTCLAMPSASPASRLNPARQRPAANTAQGARRSGTATGAPGSATS